MITYIVRRLFQLVIVLIGVTIITFLIMFAIPGDPARQLAGKNATPERIAAIGLQLGLDQSIPVQYFKFVGRLIHGDLGESYQLQRPVAQMIRENAPNTIQLALAAVLIELLGIPLGIYSALRQYTFWDITLTTAALIVWGIPVFVLGLFMQWFFGLKLNLLPLIGAGDNVLWVIPVNWNSFAALILPAVTLGLIEVAYISYMQRAAMLEVIRSDYIRTARAKGLSERKVVTRHAFKNAIIPVMTIAGIDLGALMGGAILTETVFARPGIGLMIYQAIGARDLPVVAGGVLFATLIYVFANLFVDLGYAWVDEQVGEHVNEGGEEHAAGHHGQVAGADGLVDHEADAGPREHRLGEDGAAHERAQVDAGDGHDGDDGVLEGVPGDHLALGEAFGARRADVVAADDLEHRGTLHVRDVGDLDQAQRDGGQDERGEAVPVSRDDPEHVVAGADQWQEVELEPEEPLHEQAQHEDRDTPDDQRRRGERDVPEGVLAQRRVDAERDAEELDEHRGERQLDGVGCVLADHLRHGPLELVRLAQVAVDQAPYELEVLHGDGLVEPKLQADRGDALGRGVLARQLPGGVAWDGEHDEEGDDGDADQDDDQLEQASDYVGDHVM